MKVRQTRFISVQFKRLCVCITKKKTVKVIDSTHGSSP